MIGHFPILLLIPGLLFSAAGLFYYSRAAGIDDESELGKTMAKANRSSGTLSIILGAILLVAGVPLGIAISHIYAG